MSATRLALAARIVAGLYLLLVWVLWARFQDEIATRMFVGTAIWIAYTAVLVPLLVRERVRDITVLVGVTAVIDGVSLGVLTAAVGRTEDPFFAWYIALAAVFALALRARSAWPYIGLLAISYMCGHLLGHELASPAALAFLAVKVAILMLVGTTVAYVTGAQERQRESLEEQQAEVLGLNARLERSVSELRAVSETTELIHSTLDVETVGPVLLDILQKVINIPAACMFVIDKAKQETVFSASRGVPTSVSRDYSSLELAGAVTPHDEQSAFSCLELVDHSQMIVVFCAEARSVEGLSEDDMIVLQAVASELIVAVENSRLYKLTKRLAVTDELTDLFNYRYLQQRLDDEVGRAKRYDKRLSFLMMDIDDFKRVNDTHGHLVGDTVLAELGQVLKTTVREVDVVARYGGEEFSVILPETDASGAFIVAEKVREAVALHRFPDADGERRIHITVSIGLSNYPVHALDKESLLRAADDAVYQAKQTGKDRVRAPKIRLRRLPVADAPSAEEVAE